MSEIVSGILFGAGFLPFTKPFVAALTTASIGAAGWWMNRNQSMQARQTAVVFQIRWD